MENLPIVLVVEDDVLIQSMVEEALQEEALQEGGFETAIAPSAEEALTLIRKDQQLQGAGHGH